MTRKQKNWLAFMLGAIWAGLIFVFIDPSYANIATITGGIAAVLVREGIL